MGLGLTCVRVRLRPRGFSGGSAEAEGPDEGAGAKWRFCPTTELELDECSAGPPI
jgi:hypothetical protein